MTTLSQERRGLYALARPTRPGEGKGFVRSRCGKKVEIDLGFLEVPAEDWYDSRLSSQEIRCMGVKITPRQDEHIERALKRLKKALAEEGIRHKRTRKFYQTKGEIRREERNRQRRRAIKVRREALHPQQATK
jgi:ribosomal protein S21